MFCKQRARKQQKMEAKQRIRAVVRKAGKKPIAATCKAKHSSLFLLRSLNTQPLNFEHSLRDTGGGVVMVGQRPRWGAASVMGKPGQSQAGARRPSAAGRTLVLTSERYYLHSAPDRPSSLDQCPLQQGCWSGECKRVGKDGTQMRQMGVSSRTGRLMARPEGSAPPTATGSPSRASALSPLSSVFHKAMRTSA